MLDFILLILSGAWTVFLYGGWIVLALLVLYLWFLEFSDKARQRFLAKQEWVCLSIRAPRTNTQSTLAVEQIFSQLHVVASEVSFLDKYFRGKLPPYFAFEIVSLGGKVSFLIRTTKAFRQLVESAVYAQYKDASVSEVGDYLANTKIDRLESGVGMWGAEIILKNHWSLPVSTYRDFEHMAAAEKIIDPLKPLLEFLASIEPYEIYAVQILMSPISEKKWKAEGEKFAAGLIEASPGLPEGQKAFANLPDVEKERVNRVLHKISKPGFEVKLRHLYLAPQEKFAKSRQTLGLGAYKILGNAYTNQFVEEKEQTGISPKPFVSSFLEGGLLRMRSLSRKKSLFTAFKQRRMDTGADNIILNTEEMATLYHLPLVAEEEAASTSVSGVAMKTVQPPADLPIGEI